MHTLITTNVPGREVIKPYFMLNAAEQEKPPHEYQNKPKSMEICGLNRHLSCM